MDSPVSVDKSCIKSAAFEKAHPCKLRQTSYYHFVYRFIGKRNGKNISVGIFMSRENDF
jgi:hypothetical protein